MTRHRFSFTLWEHLIVAVATAILLLLVAPPMMRSQMCLNESTAYKTLVAIAEAQERFQASAVLDEDGDGVGDFATLEQLAGSDGADAYLSAVLADGRRSGYRFRIEVVSGSRTCAPSFVCEAEPIYPKLTGWHTYSVDSTGVVFARLGDSGGVRSAALFDN